MCCKARLALGNLVLIHVAGNSNFTLAHSERRGHVVMVLSAVYAAGRRDGAGTLAGGCSAGAQLLETTRGSDKPDTEAVVVLELPFL